MLESGAVWQHRNDVQIPSGSGSRVDFDEFNQGPFFHYRAEFFWKFANRHNLRVVYAPFSLNVKGPISSNVNFNEKTFSSSEELEVNYKFNSYRLTYFYSLWDIGKKKFNLGLTGKVRDAKIQFRQTAQQANYENVGFVPLLYFELQAPISSMWYFNINMDAAAASQGRAIDVAMKFRRQILKELDFGIGVRSLEGGADNEKVFTFSWFNYAVIDLSGQF